MHSFALAEEKRAFLMHRLFECVGGTRNCVGDYSASDGSPNARIDGTVFRQGRRSFARTSVAASAPQSTSDRAAKRTMVSEFVTPCAKTRVDVAQNTACTASAMTYTVTHGNSGAPDYSHIRRSRYCHYARVVAGHGRLVDKH